ncbi:MAG: T9SS type A sorting domain-containing protein [Bacteroidales bacterium]|nr:T9SS type A sorting domain-containing protein [Bacteroidales bacterium]
MDLSLYLPGISLVDIDNDGDNDAFIGTLDGEIYFFKNKTVNVGVESINAENGLKIYPNPAVNEIKIDLSSFNNQNVSISLIDITGKTVALYNLANSNTIDISNLKSGIYFVKADSPEKTKTTKLVIK